MDLYQRLLLELAIETELGWWRRAAGSLRLKVPTTLMPPNAEVQVMKMSREIIDGQLPLPESYLPESIRKAILG